MRRLNLKISFQNAHEKCPKRKYAHYWTIILRTAANIIVLGNWGFGEGQKGGGVKIGVRGFRRHRDMGIVSNKIIFRKPNRFLSFDVLQTIH